MVKVNRNLEYATITSPIDGVVINRAVEEGQTVAAGFETPTLFTIAADLTKMQVIADVDEADIGNVEMGNVSPSPSTPTRTTYSKARSCKSASATAKAPAALLPPRPRRSLPTKW